MNGTERDIEELADLARWYVHENDSNPEVGFPVSGDAIATNRRGYAQVIAKVNVHG